MNTAFEDLVVAEAMGKADDETIKYLRTEGIDEWVAALSDLITDVDHQFAASKALIEEARLASLENGGRQAFLEFNRVRSEQATWRRRATAFKNSLISRLREARALQKQRNALLTNSRDRQKFHTLRNAIMEHRRAVTEEYEPTSADVALWDALDEVFEVSPEISVNGS